MLGRSAGTCMEPTLVVRDRERNCRRCDSRRSAPAPAPAPGPDALSDVCAGPAADDVKDTVEDASENLRSRECRLTWTVDTAGAVGGSSSLTKVGGEMNSRVLVSLRMNTNSGLGGDDGSAVGRDLISSSSCG